MDPLLFPSSTIFEGNNTIDQIRQTYIDLENDPYEEEIQFFLENVQKLISKEIDIKTANELFTTVSSCFARYPKESLSVFSNFLQNSRLNSNFIIITSCIIFELIQIQPQLNIPDFSSFIEDSLKEILPQIQNKEIIKDLTLFDHKIPVNFIERLIFNLLFASNLTEKLFSDYFNYIIYQPSFNLIADKIINMNLLKILPQTADSNNEILEFLSKKDFSCYSKMTEESQSLIKSAIVFTKSKEKKDFSIEGLNKETILQFIAISSIYLKKTNSKSKQKINDLDLILESIKAASDSVILNSTINEILQSFIFIIDHNLISIQLMLQTLELLIKQQIREEYKSNLFITIFKLSNRIVFDDLNQFFVSNGTAILQILLENLSEICKSDIFQNLKLNFKAFDTSNFENYLQETSSVEEAKQAIYFIEKLCYNVPQMKCSEDLTAILLLFFNEVIQEGLWDDALIIGSFLKKNGGYNELQEFREEETMPISVKEALYGYIVSEQDTIDQLLEKILNDPNAEQKEKSFNLLFEKMIKDKDILNYYLVLMVNHFRDYYLNANKYLTLFLNEFEKYNEDFIKATNDVYYYNANENILIKKTNFKFNSLPIPEFGLSIVSKLYKIIENEKSYQAFLCLKNIASTFPFLFNKEPQKVFDLVLPIMDDYMQLFNSNPNDDEFQQIKYVCSAFSFLLATLQSTIVLDCFVKWLFTNITSFSDPQVIALVVILRLISGENDMKIYICSVIWKYNFFETLGKLLNRCSQQEKIIKNYFQLNIYDFIEETFDIYPTFTRHELIFLEELSKSEKPFEIYYNGFIGTFPCTFLFSTIKFTPFSQRLRDFMGIINIPKPNDLCFNIANKYERQPNLIQINYFISKLTKCEIVHYDILPFLDGPLTIKMVRYLLYKPMYIYSRIFFKENLSISPEMFEELLVSFEDLSSMQNAAKDNPDGENEDSKLLNIEEFLMKHTSVQDLFTSILKNIINGGIDNQNYNTLIKAFDHFTKSDVAYVSFLSLLSDFLNKHQIKNIGNESDQLFMVGIYNLIDFSLNLPKTSIFKDSFSFTCADVLLDICLSPYCRDESILLLSISQLLSSLPKKNLTNHVIHLISFLFLTNDQKSIEVALALSGMMNIKQLESVNDLIMNAFDQELRAGDISTMFMNFMKVFPTLFIVKNYQLLELLIFLLDKYSQSTQNDDDSDFDKICFLLDFLAPKRDLSNSFSSALEKSSSLIPQFIMETSPSFWRIFEKYNDLIISKIKNEPLLLNKLKFLLNYPELITFDIRSSYFRKEMKSRINNNQKVTINVDSNNILESSFSSMKNIPTDLLYQQFNVVFDNKNTVDHGGVTSDWFTKLSKEIFNQKNGYFSCTERSMSYQPNVRSVEKNDYLEFFNFAGKFVARALLEGICIDAHLTVSLIKQILHRKPKLNDLELIDNELYQSMKWILENDVNMLEMMFEVYDETRTNSTIPLIENGSNIKVTNENKKEYVNLICDYHMEKKIKKQIDAFVDGFDSLILHNDISYFTPNELDLLICGVPEIDVEDFKANTVFQGPYTADSPVIKYFFNVISRWENDQLIKLLSFMTGRSRVSSNGFKEFCEISGQPLTINSGGDRSKLPQSHTCVNTLSLPQYESEEELEKKLKIAINLCDSFEFI